MPSPTRPLHPLLSPCGKGSVRSQHGHLGRCPRLRPVSCGHKLGHSLGNTLNATCKAPTARPGALCFAATISMSVEELVAQQCQPHEQARGHGLPGAPTAVGLPSITLSGVMFQGRGADTGLPLRMEGLFRHKTPSECSPSFICFTQSVKSLQRPPTPGSLPGCFRLGALVLRSKWSLYSSITPNTKQKESWGCVKTGEGLLDLSVSNA